MFSDLSLICTDLLLRFVNSSCGGALGTSAALFTVCVHTVSSPYYYEGEVGLSTSLFRRCSFTPHPPIRLRTQRLCVRSCISQLIGFRRAVARRSGAVSHTGTHRWYGTYSVMGSVIYMPVGLARPFGSADHWVLSDPCPGREHNAISATYPSPTVLICAPDCIPMVLTTRPCMVIDSVHTLDQTMRGTGG